MSLEDLIVDGDVSAQRIGGRLVLTSHSPLITTEADLFAACDLDPDDWIIERVQPNAWTTAMKDVEKDLEFNGSVVTGTVTQTNNARFAQNVQIKMTLLPKKMTPVELAIQPVQIAGGFRKPKPPKRTGFTRHFWFSDPHFGFRRRVRDAALTEMHDRTALDVILQICAACKPDRVDVLGDWFEMTEFSKFLLSPEFYYTLQPAINESFWWLVQFAEIAKTRLHQGNHDKRLPDAIKKNLPFAYGLRKADVDLLDADPVLSVQNLLALRSIGVDWIDDYPNDADRIAPRLHLAHGLIAKSGPIETANAVANGFVSEIFGHIHKRQYSAGEREDATGELYEVVGCSAGCACHIDRRVPGHKRNQSWSQGCGVVDVFPGGEFQIQIVAVKDGKAAWNGRVFNARNRLDDLRKDIPHWKW